MSWLVIALPILLVVGIIGGLILWAKHGEGPGSDPL
jgi:hypothetical protein